MRTTNKELSAESFMIKMMQSVGQSKVSCFKIWTTEFLFYNIHLNVNIASILNPILGRSSRKPPDPPPHAYDQ